RPTAAPPIALLERTWLPFEPHRGRSRARPARTSLHKSYLRRPSGAWPPACHDAPAGEVSSSSQGLPRPDAGSVEDPSVHSTVHFTTAAGVATVGALATGLLGSCRSPSATLRSLVA